MERDDGVAPIVRSAEKLGQLGLGHFLPDARDFGRGLGESIFTLLFFGDVEKEARLFQIRAMLRPSVNNALKRGLLPYDPLSFFRVVPKIRLIGEPAYILDPLLFAVDVKDASVKARVALPGG